MAFAHEFVHAESWPSAACGLHKIWFDGLDYNQSFVRRERRPVLSNSIWLDGSRVPLRADKGKNLGAVEFLKQRG